MIIWHPMDQPPAVETGGHERVLVAWRDRASGHRSSGEMYFLNAMELFFDEPPPNAMPVPGGFYACTGWHDCADAADGSTLFTPLDDMFVEHLGWTPMPIMPEAGE